MIPGIRTRLGMRPKLLADWISNDGVLDGDVLGTNTVNIIPLSKLDGDMVKDHRASIEQINTTFAGIRVQISLAEADIADNIIRCAAERDFAAHNTNACTRRSGSINREGTGDTHGRRELNISTDVEVNDPVALA